MSTKYILTTKSVNSKPLALLVRSFIEEGFDQIMIQWAIEEYRTSFVEVIEDWLEELRIINKIEQYKVICDLRNNHEDDFEKGNFNLDVVYKQRNCLNTTKLEYNITGYTT